jgi:acetate kinase
LSGVSNDIRDIETAAEGATPGAAGARRFRGARVRGAGSARYFAGVERRGRPGVHRRHRREPRRSAGRHLRGSGRTRHRLDPETNAAARRWKPSSGAGTPVKVLVIPTNEELVVAREVKRLLEALESA